MTKGELLKRLEEFPDDAPVVTPDLFPVVGVTYALHLKAIVLSDVEDGDDHSDDARTAQG